jgi:hypothetical protein
MAYQTGKAIQVAFPVYLPWSFLMHTKIIWEYRVETIGSTFRGTADEDIEEVLDEWGQEGWEVIAFHPLYGSNKATIVAKREQFSSQRRKSETRLQW